jgi:subtilisin family serine protease
VPAEVAAIKWAVAQGARVINLSLGAIRDPLDRSVDSYSPLEQAAIEAAYAEGVVVVAAVGNGPPKAPRVPWGFADYPAALPHVIGVSAVRQDRSVPDFSNRDAVYNDLAAPGDGMFSTVPTNLVTAGSGCTEPYSDCGPPEFRNAIGTSFAAPQVSAAAALLLGVQPKLRPEQVSYLLERSAADDTPATGCPDCSTGRDPLTGWGTLDVASALTLLTSGSPLPPPDAYEPNDDAGPWSHALPPLPRTISATLDYWDDNIDVYRVTLKKGQSLYARLTPGVAATVRLALWAPGTKRVESLDLKNDRVTESRRQGLQARLAYRARVAGTYYLEAKLISPAHDPVPYRLALTRRSA